VTRRNTRTTQGLHPKKGSGYTLPRRGASQQWAGAWAQEKDDMMYFYGCCTRQFTEAFPVIACSSGQNMALVLGSPSCPRRLACAGTLWKFAPWLPWKPLCSNRLAEQLLAQGFAYAENLSEEFICSVQRKFVAAMLSFPLCGNFSQYSS